MRALSWTLSEVTDPLKTAESLQGLLRPYELIIDTHDGYAQQIEKLAELVVAAGKTSWRPLEVLKANAIKYGPQYRLRFQTETTSIKGFVNRSEICFILDDAANEDVVKLIQSACGQIKGAIQEQFKGPDS